MKVDEQLIRKVASLARLNLSDAEVKEFLPQMKEILESFSMLDEVDVSKTEISFQPVELKNAVRQDKVEPSLPEDVALSNSEHKKDGYFKGPRAV